MTLHFDSKLLNSKILILNHLEGEAKGRSKWEQNHVATKWECGVKEALQWQSPKSVRLNLEDWCGHWRW